MKISGTNYDDWAAAVNLRTKIGYTVVRIWRESQRRLLWWVMVYVCEMQAPDAGAIRLEVDLGPVREQAEPTFGPVEEE